MNFNCWLCHPPTHLFFLTSDVTSPHPFSLIQTINALIVDHLRLCGFDFSLSLFLPESGVASVEAARQSLRTGLGPDAEAAFDRRMHETPDESLLVKLFQPVTRFSGERSVQTRRVSGADVFTQTELHQKEYDGHDDRDDGDQDSFQRRFFLMKKAVEERKKAEVASEMEKYKEGELKTVELDYARKLDMEREKLRLEFEEKYKQRNSHLDTKEKELEGQIKRKSEETERELSNQRNVLIDELQRSKIKEENIRSRESELERRRDEAEKRLSNLREILEQREKMVKERENDVEEKVRVEVRRVLGTAEEEREERLKLLKKEEERIAELKDSLEKRKREQDLIVEEEEAKTAKLKNVTSLYNREKEAREDLEEEVAKMRRRMEAVESLENLQLQNQSLRRDLEEAMVRCVG